MSRPGWAAGPAPKAPPPKAPPRGPRAAGVRARAPRERGPGGSPAPGARGRECLTWQFPARLNSARRAVGQRPGKARRERRPRRERRQQGAGTRRRAGSGEAGGGGSDQVTPRLAGRPPRHSRSGRGAARRGGGGRGLTCGAQRGDPSSPRPRPLWAAERWGWVGVGISPRPTPESWMPSAG